MKRSVTVYTPNRWGFPAIRLEFGPWWFRWWLILMRGGTPHRTGLGEPCVLFPAPPHTVILPGAFTAPEMRDRFGVLDVPYPGGKSDVDDAKLRVTLEAAAFQADPIYSSGLDADKT